MSLISACTGLADTSPADSGDSGSGAGSVDDSAAPAGDAVAIDSRYTLSSVFSITTASLAPEPAYQLLADLDDDPGRALITLADAAGVPAADLLFASLPDSLKGSIATWMTDAIGSDGLAEVQVLLAWSRLVLADVEVHSTLEIGSVDDGGHAQAAHMLDSFLFHIEDLVVAEDIPQIDGLPGAGHAELEVRVQRDDEGLHLLMEQQRYGLLFGEAAYRAFQSVILAHYGTDLRGVLGDAIDCPSMASEVAARCVLGACVGHTSELIDLCNGALDSAAEQVHAQFAALDMEVLDLEAGSALVLASGGGTRLAGGEWQAQVELGQGLRRVPAHFSGESF